jgi:transcriptional regulator with XRE-family HTH domain
VDFGQTLKETRTRLNYSQMELSEKTGLTVRTIQRIENNSVRPSLHSIKAINAALGTDLKESQINTEEKPYIFQLTIQIKDMNRFITDLRNLVTNHWKFILIIILLIFLVTNYTDIKKGISDGWGNT